MSERSSEKEMMESIKQRPETIRKKRLGTVSELAGKVSAALFAGSGEQTSEAESHSVNSDQQTAQPETLGQANVNSGYYVVHGGQESNLDSIEFIFPK